VSRELLRILSDKMLTERLADLIASGLIMRKRLPARGKQTRGKEMYILTTKGRSFREARTTRRKSISSRQLSAGCLRRRPMLVIRGNVASRYPAPPERIGVGSGSVVAVAYHERW
jgi:hypothetical protein